MGLTSTMSMLTSVSLSASSSKARNASRTVRPLWTTVPVPGADSGVMASTSKLRWMPAVPLPAMSRARRMTASIPIRSMSWMEKTVTPASFIRRRSRGSMSRPPIWTHFSTGTNTGSPPKSTMHRGP